MKAAGGATTSGAAIEAVRPAPDGQVSNLLKAGSAPCTPNIFRIWNETLA